MLVTTVFSTFWWMPTISTSSPVLTTPCSTLPVALQRRVEQGVVKTGEEVEIVGIHQKVEKTVVTGVEMFRKLLDQGQAGDNVGCLLRGVKREEIERGQVLAKPGSITPHTQFEAQVYVLSKDEGGRHTPFFKGYRPSSTSARPTSPASSS